MVEFTYRAFDALNKRVSNVEKELAGTKTSTIQWVVSVGIGLILVVLGIVSVYTGLLIYAGK